MSKAKKGKAKIEQRDHEGGVTTGNEESGETSLERAIKKK